MGHGDRFLVPPLFCKVRNYSWKKIHTKSAINSEARKRKITAGTGFRLVPAVNDETIKREITAGTGFRLAPAVNDETRQREFTAGTGFRLAPAVIEEANSIITAEIWGLAFQRPGVLACNRKENCDIIFSKGIRCRI